jgi:hypothetical protein
MYGDVSGVLMIYIVRIGDMVSKIRYKPAWQTSMSSASSESLTGEV